MKKYISLLMKFPDHGYVACFKKLQHDGDFLALHESNKTVNDVLVQAVTSHLEAVFKHVRAYRGGKFQVAYDEKRDLTHRR